MAFPEPIYHWEDLYTRDVNEGLRLWLDGTNFPWAPSARPIKLMNIPSGCGRSCDSAIAQAWLDSAKCEAVPTPRGHCNATW